MSSLPLDYNHDDLRMCWCEYIRKGGEYEYDANDRLILGDTRTRQYLSTKPRVRDIDNIVGTRFKDYGPYLVFVSTIFLEQIVVNEFHQTIPMKRFIREIHLKGYSLGTFFRPYFVGIFRQSRVCLVQLALKWAYSNSNSSNSYFLDMLLNERPPRETAWREVVWHRWGMVCFKIPSRVLIHIGSQYSGVCCTILTITLEVYNKTGSTSLLSW